MRIAALLFLAPSLVSCSLMQLDHDALCHELVRFANAEAPIPRAVQLTNDWSMRPDPDNPGKFFFATKTCSHENIQAEKNLCSYLMEHTSTEFPVTNYQRALRCMGTLVTIDAQDRHPLPDQVKTYQVLGVRLTSELTVAFSSDEVLKISAGEAR